MEPNKELPKEGSLNEKMYDAALDELTYDDFLGILGISSAVDKCHDIAQSYYAPIIEAKDKQLSEKDKRIAELDAEKYRQNEKYEELARLYGKTVNDLSAANTGKELLKAERSKLMGLLKECYIKTRDGRALGVKMAITWAMSQEAGYDKAFECYCKENGIDLGESKRKK